MYFTGKMIKNFSMESNQLPGYNGIHLSTRKRKVAEKPAETLTSKRLASPLPRAPNF